MPQLDTAIEILREAAPLGVDRAAVFLQTKGISGQPFHPKSLLAAAEFCGRAQSFEIENSIGVPRVIVEKRREFTHVGTDMWSLRGTKVDAAAVEALREANAARPNERRIIDHGWTERGELWLAARLPEDPSHFVLGIPSPIRRFVAGREFPASDENGVTAGPVPVNN